MAGGYGLRQGMNRRLPLAHQTQLAQFVAAAHRHLGVSESDLERWADKAGLAVRSAKTFRSPDGDKGIAVMVWSADSQKSAKRSAA